jgi:hypothetical protein
MGNLRIVVSKMYSLQLNLVQPKGSSCVSKPLKTNKVAPEGVMTKKAGDDSHVEPAANRTTTSSKQNHKEGTANSSWGVFLIAAPLFFFGGTVSPLIVSQRPQQASSDETTKTPKHECSASTLLSHFLFFGSAHMLFVILFFLFFFCSFSKIGCVEEFGNLRSKIGAAKVHESPPKIQSRGSRDIQGRPLVRGHFW